MISPFIIQGSFRVTVSFSRMYMLQVVHRKHLASTVCLSDKILWQSQSHHCCVLCNGKNHSNALAFVTRDWITSKNVTVYPVGNGLTSLIMSHPMDVVPPYAARNALI